LIAHIGANANAEPVDDGIQEPEEYS